MADKITNFEEYKNRDLEKPVENKESSEQSAPQQESAEKPTPKRDLSETTVINSIQIEDPYNFFTEEEREEYFRQRQKEEMERAGAPEQPQRKEIPEEPVEEERPIRERREYREDFYEDYDDPDGDYYRDEDDDYYGDEDDRDYGGYSEDYGDDYDDRYDDEEDEESDDKLMRVVVKIAAVLTGMLILGFIVGILKVKVFDRFFYPDPDKETAVTEEEPAPVTIPEGYRETNDTVYVNAEFLNLRSTPDTSGEDNIEEKAGNGTELKRIAVSDDGKWAYVEYNGKQLYGYMKYLTTP
ncbi:MAG: hypothetical protein IKZ97_06020 [Butyrivibrio sp.]|nr:hypothetical protein [Butyrivibrio sp.]